MADEEEVEEAQPAATEFVPEASGKPKSNVYTTLLILAFVAFFAGSWISGNEAWQHYDVQFFGMFKKTERKGGEAAPATTGTNASTETPAPSKEPMK
jgi:hypothetical protein